MTLIVGVRCKDGVVVGADSAATSSSADRIPTVRNENARKLAILHNVVIVGTSGSMSMGQRIRAVVGECWNGKFMADKDGKQTAVPAIAGRPDDGMATLRACMWQAVYGPESNAAKFAQGAGWGGVAGEAATTTLFAAPFGKRGPVLFEFNAVGLQQEMTEEIFCSAIGSGQAIADPFLGFIRRVLWKDQMPDIRHAVLGVIWCLDHAISVHPGGVGGHVQVAVLSKPGANWEAKELTDAEYAEHRNNIKTAEQMLTDWHDGKLPQATAPAPPASPVKPP